MPSLSASALLMLTLLSASPAPTLPGHTAWAAEVHRIELPADAAGAPPEVRITPGLATTMLFDTPIVTAGVRLEGCERCRVTPAKDAVILVPAGELRTGQTLKLVVPFADDAAPASAEFLLVVHPMTERQVEVFRQRRTVESLRAELLEKDAAARRCHQDLARLRTEFDGPGGLIGVLASKLMGREGISSRLLTHQLTQRPGSALMVLAAFAYRAHERVAVDLELVNPGGSRPWTAVGARLAGKGGELRVITLWQPAPIASGLESGRLVVEADATEAQAHGPFTLTLWDEDGQRTVVIANVTFP